MVPESMHRSGRRRAGSSASLRGRVNISALRSCAKRAFCVLGNEMSLLFDDRRRDRIRRHLGSLEVLSAEPGASRVAAVAVAVVEEGHGARVEGVAAPLDWSSE